jgi:glyoxylase-like metal-dependent hydrolase (beta-lactamase superfamily II)
MSIQVEIVPVTPFSQNCALIFDSETKLATVIDPGGDVPKILAAITAAGVTVENILLTHGHLDHAGGATELGEKLGLPVTGPGIEDAFLLAEIADHARQFGFAAQNCKPASWLTEGEIVKIAGAEFEVLHCPGHTPGHVVFVNRAEKFGIFGDVLFRNSVGRTDFPYGDHSALITAIKTKLLLLPDDFTFICGHGEPSRIGAEKRSNPFIQ